jgi:hypothetical protein
MKDFWYTPDAQYPMEAVDNIRVLGKSQEKTAIWSLISPILLIPKYLRLEVSS